MKVYIPEPIPSGNKGEEAILQGIAQGFKNSGVDADISVFSYDTDLENDIRNYEGQFKVVSGITFRPRPYWPLHRRIIETIEIWMKHFFFALLYRVFGEKAYRIFREENWAEYGNADLILVGHDGFISDLNLILALFVKAIGKKSVIFGGGFKSFKRGITEFLAKYIFKTVEIIVVREKNCYDYLKAIDTPIEKLFFRPDPAFVMKPVEAIEIREIFLKEGLNNIKPPLIGMIVLVGTSYYKYFYGDAPNDRERYELHMNLCAEMAENIIDISGGNIVFIPHALKTEFGQDDRECAKEIKNRMKRNKDNVFLINNEYSARALKGVIKDLDFIVSQRLHAIIGAVTTATPFIMVTVEEDTRSQDIITYTVKKPELIFNINNPDINDFNSQFRDLWSAKDQIKDDLELQGKNIFNACNNAFKIMLKNFS